MNYYTDVLKKYAVFAGRARRKEYWMFALWNALIGVVLFLPGIITKNQILEMIPFIYFLAVFIPSLALSVRRLHDTGRSGWWFLINLIPYVGGIVMFVFMVLDSKPGDNKYGPNPKGIGASVAAPTTT